MAGVVKTGKERQNCGRGVAARDATHRDGTATSRASASDEEPRTGPAAAVVVANSGKEARKES